MDTKKIKELVLLLEQSQLESLEIKNDEFEIKMSKPSNSVVTMPIQSQVSEKTTIISEEVETIKDTFNSPLVGTFYGKPSPDAESFVTVGQKIEIGDVLCIIEAMKVMNEIKTTKAGTVKEILIDDETMVEFDQPLFVIE